LLTAVNLNNHFIIYSSEKSIYAWLSWVDNIFIVIGVDNKKNKPDKVECVRFPWLQAETKVATILGKLFLLLLGLGVSLLKPQ
jgi:hypothetical protein